MKWDTNAFIMGAIAAAAVLAVNGKLKADGHRGIDQLLIPAS